MRDIVDCAIVSIAIGELERMSASASHSVTLWTDISFANVARRQGKTLDSGLAKEDSTEPRLRLGGGFLCTVLNYGVS